MFLLHRLHAVNFKQLTDTAIRFPESGTVLIEGSNEAGKSTLFEAVYFALYGDALLDGQKLENLKRYGADEMRVELEFSVGGRRFEIRRRYASNQSVQFDFEDESGQQQSVKGIRPVRESRDAELRISAAALLNTCYVQQKDLGRLENLDVKDRRATINELLNLRVLTAMEEQFKPRREHEDALKRQRERVAVAELDFALPALEAEARQAFLCLRYTQAQSAAREIARLEAEIGRAQERQRGVYARRSEIAGLLQACDILRARIAKMEDSLPLLARNWKKAQEDRAGAEEQIRELRALASELPARHRQLAERKTLAERLAALETLEDEAEILRNDGENKTQELKAWDAQEREWQEGEEKRGALAQGIAEKQQALQQAEAALHARRTVNLRLPKLVALIGNAESIARLDAEIAQLESERDAAQEQENRLPDLEARRDALGNALDRLAIQAENRRELARAEEARDNAQQEQQAHAARLAHIERLAGEAQAAQERAETARAEEARAAETLRQAQRRQALAEWAEAAERLAEADPHSAGLQKMEAEQAQAEEKQQAAAGEIAASERRRNLGIGLIVVGIAGGAALMLAQAWIGIVVGLLLVAAGAVPILQGSKARAAARQAQEAARNQSIERNAQITLLRSQASEFAARQAERAAREADQRRRLETSGVSLPASPEEARRQIAQIPAVTLADAQETHREAQTARIQAEAGARSLASQQAEKREEARTFDAESVAERLDGAQQRVQALGEALAADADLPGLLATLGVASASPEERASALNAARDAAATAQAQRDRLPGLEAQWEAKKEQAEQETRQAQQAAGVLGLPGSDGPAWKAAAAEEREAIRAAKTTTPDVTLETREAEARQARDDARAAFAGLESLQAERQKRLEARPRAAILAEREEIEATLAANDQEQQAHSGARPALQESGLPLRSGELTGALAREEQLLETDEGRASALPQVEAQRQERIAGEAAWREDLTTAWRETLPEEALPAAPAEALERLPQIRGRLQAQLAASGEAQLHDEDSHLAGEAETLTAQAAAWKQEAGAARRQQAQWLAELGAQEGETPDALPERLPELARAGEHDPEGWQSAREAAQQAIQENRTARSVRAAQLGLDDSHLDLEEEQKACRSLILDLDVKRRAVQIVENTRKSIVSRVMPQTLQNMRRFLPLLTEGRYQDVEWDEEKSSLAVYDNQARAFQRKSVFSGGAKDQISLALRLGFALATLPGEIGTRPGWLFLDEPISSFDRARTLALVDLLTRGLLRREFRQIFLVSHSESFSPDLFAYRIRMEGGRIAETNLPC